MSGMLDVINGEVVETESRFAIVRRASQTSSVTMPCHRSGLRMFCQNSYLYIIGGFCSEQRNPILREIWRFNTLTNNWKRMPVPIGALPLEMISFACCSVNTNKDDHILVFFFGGTLVPFGAHCSNKISYFASYNGIYKYEELKTTGDIPPPQYGSNLLQKDCTLYLIGGTTGWIYNIEVRSLRCDESGIWQWELLNDGSEYKGRYRHESVLVGDEILIFGGAGEDTWVASLDKILVFNLSTKRFSLRLTTSDPKHGYPNPRFSHGCVRKDNFIYVFGGCSYGERIMAFQTYNVFDDVWMLDMSCWRWQQLDVKLGEGSCFHGSTIANDGALYVFGGALDMSLQHRSSRLWSYQISPPSLFYLAARALLKSNLLRRSKSLNDDVTYDNIFKVMNNFAS